MYPCGLIAQSLFNDTLFLREKSTGDYVMWNMWNDENTPCVQGGKRPCPTNPSGIAWASDLSKKFKAPNMAWIQKNCKYLGGAALNTSGWIDAEFGKMLAAGDLKPAGNCGAPSCGYRVHVDGQANSGIYNCWHNVTDEDFVVWMRVAALPSFKKLPENPKGRLEKGHHIRPGGSQQVSCGRLQGRQAFRAVDDVVDRRQEQLPGLRLCGGGLNLRRAGAGVPRETAHLAA